MSTVKTTPINEDKNTLVGIGQKLVLSPLVDKILLIQK